MKLRVCWLAWQTSGCNEYLLCNHHGAALHPAMITHDIGSECIFGFSEEEVLSSCQFWLQELLKKDDPNWSIQSFEFDTEEM